MAQPTEHSEQTPSSTRSRSGTVFPAGSFSVSAPTGQADTHCPQEMQDGSSPRGTPNEGETMEEKPRLMYPKTPIPCTSRQMRTQRPQRTHLEGSRAMRG